MFLLLFAIIKFFQFGDSVSKKIAFSSGWSLTWDQWEKKLIPEKNLAQKLKKPFRITKENSTFNRTKLITSVTTQIQRFALSATSHTI